jgi:hypothetical protein
MIKKASYLLLGLVVVATAVLSPLNSQRAFAATTDLAPRCTNTNLENWNWPDAVKNSTTGSPAGAGLTTFDPTADSYVIFHNPTNSGRNIYNLWWAGTGTKLTFSYDSATSKPVLVKSGGTLDGAEIISEPVTDPTFKAVWGSFTSNYSPVYSTGFHSSPPASPWNWDSSQEDCVYTAHNVGYDPSFLALYNQFSNQVAWTVATGSKCSALDVGCWISKAVDGVDNAFLAFLTSVGHFVGNLFLPKASDMADSFDGLNTFMHANLGFLVYPFTFFGDLFTAFTTSTSGCTTSSCTISFGNFFGHNFSINYLAANSLGNLMTYVRTVVQAMTVLALVFGIRNKYMEMVKR